MKEYRLVAWPQLRAPFDRIAYRRLLGDMSHRHRSLSQLTERSGLRRDDARAFLAMLDADGLVAVRDSQVPDSLFGSLRPLGGWLKRAIAGSSAEV